MSSSTNKVDSTTTHSSSVFEAGEFSVVVKTVNSGGKVPESSPPKAVYIVAPVAKGVYPVILFLHGFFINNNSYSDLLQHVASHGYIVVAPQLYKIISPCSDDDIKSAAAVADWLSTGLLSFLPEMVEPDLSKLALAGHSRGGNAAFALALGYVPTRFASFSLLLGIDPVSGKWNIQIPPKILSGKPGSLELKIPVLVVGSGLKSSCAPEGTNHDEFFKECRAPCCHVVVDDFGHLDMLDDGSEKLAKCVCKKGKESKVLMRRTVAGVVVAFTKAYLGGGDSDLAAIVGGSVSPPAKCTITYDKE